jgi:hypothetical protein
MRVLSTFSGGKSRVIKEVPVPLDQVKVTTEENKALETRGGRSLKDSVNIVANKGIRQQIATPSHREQQGIV